VIAADIIEFVNEQTQRRMAFIEALTDIISKASTNAEFQVYEDGKNLEYSVQINSKTYKGSMRIEEITSRIMNGEVKK